jgi:tRNA dimethylallyltransferase
MSKSLIVVLGPTAVGKTSLAIQLAKAFDTEIISADSRQFFREMAIGTAKPSFEDLVQVKHHFIDSHSIHEHYNAGIFEEEALQLLEKLFLKHDKVILVGGSGLYINALCYGMDQLPDANSSIREELRAKLEFEGIHVLQEKLKSLDPDYYNTVDINNPQRIMRAIEVCLASGKAYSSMLSQQRRKRPFQIYKIGLNLEREELYERINRRVDQMIESGLVNEVKSLYDFRTNNALQTVGYKELFDFLEGKIRLEEAISEIKQNTRRYAKRQLTWFRKDQEIQWFEPDQKKEILEYLERTIT